MGCAHGGAGPGRERESGAADGGFGAPLSVPDVRSRDAVDAGRGVTPLRLPRGSDSSSARALGGRRNGASGPCRGERADHPWSDGGRGVGVARSLGSRSEQVVAASAHTTSWILARARDARGRVFGEPCARAERAADAGCDRRRCASTRMTMGMADAWNASPPSAIAAEFMGDLRVVGGAQRGAEGTPCPRPPKVRAPTRQRASRRNPSPSRSSGSRPVPRVSRSGRRTTQKPSRSSARK